jgi:LDH2 family malate/lactate/ureidoglycolate dehydrogenase
MAPSLVARGKLRNALRRGEKNSLDWALDAEGKPSDDPAEALKGFMQPMGGPKRSALAIMMDVFSGVLSGSAFAGHVTGQAEPSKVADVGHFIVTLKADLCMDMDAFHERMQCLYDRVVKSEPAAGVQRIYFPGEIERLLKEEREEKGIP